MDPDLPQISIINVDKIKDEKEINFEDKSNLIEYKGMSKSSINNSISLKSESKSPLQNQMEITPITETHLKPSEIVKEALSKESFEWNNFLVRRA